MKTRYSYGGDEHIFVEVDENMSLDAFFKSLNITKKVRSLNIPGITEICPANASFQIKFNPDIISPEKMMKTLKSIEVSMQETQSALKTRIIEIPVFYRDPWTQEILMQFRDRHQYPEGNDLDYAAKINGFSSADEFIKAHHSNPWFVSMVGFVSGLPFMYQIAKREKQLEVPKYLRPRTDTPKLTIGHGGCFSCIYSVRGAGGYQMFGVTPMPIFDPEQKVSYMKESMVFFNPGDIVQFKPIDRTEYDTILKKIEKEEFFPRIRPAEFSLQEFKKDIRLCNKKLREVLYDN